MFPFLRCTTLLLAFIFLCNVNVDAIAQTTNVSEAPAPKIESVVRLIKLTWKANPTAAAKSLIQLTTQTCDSDEQIAKTQQLWQPSQALLQDVMSQPNDPRYAAVSCLMAAWDDPQAIENIQPWIVDVKQIPEVRMLAGKILARHHADLLAKLIRHSLSTTDVGSTIQTEVAELALNSGDNTLVLPVLKAIPTLPAEIRPTVVERATQRPTTSLPLLELVAAGEIAKDLFNSNQLQRLDQSPDQAVVALVKKIWGTIRTDNRDDRLQAIASTNKTLRELKGNTENGWPVFQRVCGQCHILHERGFEVGPNLSQNGRGSYTQLLSNVLDPSLVIGNAYQAYTVLTVDGRVLTGLLAEDSPERIILKIQGGKTETIPRDEIEEAKVSPKSLMPEGLETQMTPQEIADLFALLTLEKVPGTNPNSLIPETPASLHGQ